jgi:acetyl esterase/lipase
VCFVGQQFEDLNPVGRKRMHHHRSLQRLCLWILTFPCLWAQVPSLGAARVDSNVIYGMYSGLALLLDMYAPEKPNGYAVIFINGSGWSAPLAYDAEPLKNKNEVRNYLTALLDRGYTVFSVNHRATPRFLHPAAVEDIQRATRFIRYHAQRFGIIRDRIGAAGVSSGGHLVALLGVLDGTGDAQDADPINRESAKVQCVVAFEAPLDLLNGDARPGAFHPYLGVAASTGPSMLPKTSVEYRKFEDASPIHHVTRDDPPFLLVHGDADQIVPFKHSELMEQALRAAGVEVKLLRVPGGGHGASFRGPSFRSADNWPDYTAEMVRWFDSHLASAAPTPK